ncbi:dTDP-4-dehydrorhamnose 3,5-epimerase [Candidatus Gracilibacteria bacterium]|nr:dTDP-4-dehydrorhamnose 3,5-epimerase [Candidatus Gracilibacteria bacterium]
MSKFKNAEIKILGKNGEDIVVIPGLKIIEPKIFGDERGFFFESYSKKDFQENGINIDFVQDNHSKSQKGVLRGLHFQFKNPQDKLVRVVKGAVYDVVVDIRKNSPTFGKWFGIVLSAENKKQLFVPKGFAHGFLSLENGTEFLYKCSDFYNSEGEGGYSFDNEKFGINWKEIAEKYGIESFILSEKDKKYEKFSEEKIYFY